MTERPDNADIERELYQLGLSDSPPRARRTLPSQGYQLTPRAEPPFIYPSEIKYSPAGTTRLGLERLHSLPHDIILDGNVLLDDVYGSPAESWRSVGIRSSSAPAMPFERSLSYSEEALLLSGIGRLRGASQETRSLNDVEPTRRRSSSQGSATARSNARAYYIPHVSVAPSSNVRQDPRGVHYPGYVELKDFLTLPRGPSDSIDDGLTFDEEVEAEMIERQLIASVEAMLRRVHAGIQESYIHYEHPDSIAEPPPPQPVGATLSDPPPSPEPPHNHISPPQPTYNGIRSNHVQRMQYTRGLPVAPTCVTTTPLRPPPAAFQPLHPPRRGMIVPPRLIDPNNASVLSRQVGFIPIPDPSVKKQDIPKSNHHRHHHHLHRPHDHHPPVEQQVSSAAQHPHLHHHHMHHQRKKSSKALKRIKNVAAIARGSGIKIVKIRRDLANFMGFGFSIKGSLEGGFGVYVSRVEETGPAWTAGLRPGDLLLAANNNPVSQMDHTEIISKTAFLATGFLGDISETMFMTSTEQSVKD